MVAMGAARMIPEAPDPFEVLRAELVEALARMVHRVIKSGKGEAQAAVEQLERIRTNLAEVGSIDDFLPDLDAAEQALLVYLMT
jgi:hypothetical protein